MADRLSDEELDAAEQRFAWRTQGAISLSTRCVARRAIAELRERRSQDLTHAANHCLDCEGPLVQCDCQPNCPGGMCARKCYATNGPMMPALTAEEREALALVPAVLEDALHRATIRAIVDATAEPKRDKIDHALVAIAKLLGRTEGR